MKRLAIVFFFLFISASLPAATLQDLDFVLNEAGSIDNFLHRTNSSGERYVDIYYKLAADYFGNGENSKMNFSRSSYDAILKQLDKLIQKAPQLKSQIWQHASSASPYTISRQDPASIQTPEQLAMLKEKSRGVDENQIRVFVEKVRQEQELVPGMQQKTRAGMRNFFIKLRADPQYQKISAYLLLKHQENLSGLSGLEKNLSNEEKIFLSGMKDLLPSGSNLVKLSSINVTPLKRNFHGLFKGLVSNECVGGSCDPSYGSWLTPRRWATSILEGSEFHVLEENGRYKGFVQLVPMVKIKPGADINVSTNPNPNPGYRYVSVDFGSSLFKRPELLDSWMKEYSKIKPRPWRLSVSSGNALENYGVMPGVQKSFYYQMGPTINDPQNFKHEGNIAEVIEKESVGIEMDHRYGNKMIHEISNSKVHDVKVLIPFKEDALKNITTLNNILKSGHVDAKNAILLKKYNSKKWNAQTWEIITDLALSGDAMVSPHAGSVLKQAPVFPPGVLQKLHVFWKQQCQLQEGVDRSKLENALNILIAEGSPLLKQELKVDLIRMSKNSDELLRNMAIKKLLRFDHYNALSAQKELLNNLSIEKSSILRKTMESVLKKIPLGQDILLALAGDLESPDEDIAARAFEILSETKSKNSKLNLLLLKYVQGPNEDLSDLSLNLLLKIKPTEESFYQSLVRVIASEEVSWMNRYNAVSLFNMIPGQFRSEILQKMRLAEARETHSMVKAMLQKTISNLEVKSSSECLGNILKQSVR